MENFYDQLEGASDEQLWGFFFQSEGEYKADALTQIVLGYNPEISGLPKISMAELAMEIYLEAGCSEDSSDFAFLWAEIAENRAVIEDYPGAVEAGTKALELLQLNEISGYQDLPWNMVRWLGLSGQKERAHQYLDELIKQKKEG